MKQLYWLFFCFPLALNAQSSPPAALQRATSLHADSLSESGSEGRNRLGQPIVETVDKERVNQAANFEEALRKLGPDLITPRLTINREVLDNLLGLLEVQPDTRLVLAVDHTALSVRYTLVHRLLEVLEEYPLVNARVDVEMYAPISKYHTTWLYERKLGHLMIRQERLAR